MGALGGNSWMFLFLLFLIRFWASKPIPKCSSSFSRHLGYQASPVLSYQAHCVAWCFRKSDLGSGFPNSFRKNQSHIPSQANLLQEKRSYIDPLLIRFSSKSGQNIGIHKFRGAFLENPVFYIRPSEVSFPLGRGAGGDLGPGKGGEWLLRF